MINSIEKCNDKSPSLQETVRVGSLQQLESLNLGGMRAPLHTGEYQSATILCDGYYWRYENGKSGTIQTVPVENAKVKRKRGKIDILRAISFLLLKMLNSFPQYSCST